MTDTLLEINNLTKSFGGLVAVDDVSIEVEEGTIVGMIGPNGAGKTTLLNLISGFYRPDDGTVMLNREDITDLKPHKRSQKGMVRTFQITKQLSGMTVLDNMLVAHPDETDDDVLRNLVAGSQVSTKKREVVDHWIEELDLDQVRDEYAGNLSGGQQKLLELGRALITEPDLLLLDEPMAGVNPALTDELSETIRSLKSEGMTFVVIEHDMDLIMSISDEVIALNEGRVLTQGKPSEVQQNEEVLESYLGGE
jgi:branched-chain amino acid transport system ATP-binding protein